MIKFKSGQFVRRSDHSREQLCYPADRPHDFGLVVEIKIFGTDPGERIEYWPRVLWQGNVVSSLCHPLNVTPIHITAFLDVQ